MPSNDPNVGVAFALVIGAGAATAVGACVVFFPSLVKYASRRTLAAGLGLSAGVMTYVSFVEIFIKSTDSFVDAGHGEDNAYIYSSLCFFAGVVIMVLLNHVVTRLLGGHHHHHHHDNDDFLEQGKEEERKPRRTQSTMHDDTAEGFAHQEATERSGKEVEELEENQQQQQWEGTSKPSPNEGHGGSAVSFDDDNGTSMSPENAAVNTESEEAKKLMRMSINTAMAIGLHNFPEGLATFVAALDDPRVGGVLAIAIAIHNIPEGLCVAMPIYYATGDRWKAFWWAIISGVSEPVAALLGWAVLANSFSDTLYALLFGLVSGMMVIISVRELLPTAHRYDPEDYVVTYSFMVGMAIMSLSLVLFRL